MIAQVLATLRRIDPHDAAALCLALAIALLVTAACVGRHDWREWE